MSKPEYDHTPEGVARDLYAMASLIEFWLAAEDQAAPLTDAEVAEALSPFEVDPASPEYACLAGLPQAVRATLAENFEVGRRELEPVLRGVEGGPGAMVEAVRLAQGKIRGSLRIVRKLAGGALPGWIQEIWDIHVGE